MLVKLNWSLYALCRHIQFFLIKYMPVYQSILKEISPRCSLEGLMLKLKLPILWPPDVKSWLIGKDTDAGKDWGQEKKGTTEDEMVGWHHQLNGHGFGWASGVGDGQGGLVCCSSCRCKELDTTERLNWTELNGKYTQSTFCPFQKYGCLSWRKVFV